MVCLGCAYLLPDPVARTCYCSRDKSRGERGRRIPERRGEQICSSLHKPWDQVPRSLFSYKPSWCTLR